MTSIRTPLNTGQALALGGGSARYRKQLLKRGPLHYQGGIVNIDEQMLSSICTAFDAKAQKRVPFQLAGPNNEHDCSPDRRRGWVTALHLTDEGLDGVLELEDEAARMVETDPELGVSVLVSPVETGEGDKWPAVLQHVLATYSPVVTTLSDWQIAASQTPDDLIDFLALSATPDDEPSDSPTDRDGSSPAVDSDVARAENELAEAQAAVAKAQDAYSRAQAAARHNTPDPSSGEGAHPDPSEGTTAVPSLKDLLKDADADDLKALRAKLDEIAPANDSVTPADEPTDDDVALDDTDISDDEMEEAAAIVADLFTEDEPVAVAASQAASDEADRLALANAQISEQGLALAQMQRRLDEATWKEERDALILANVPPVIVELAKPFLHGSDARLALSQDGQAKAAAQVRRMLKEIGGQLKLGVGTAPVGTSLDAGEEAEARQAAETRNSAVSASLSAAGLLGNQGRKA